MRLSQPGAGQRRAPQLRLVRAEQRTFPGHATFLQDPAARAHLAGYLSDLTAVAGQPAVVCEADLLGQSYGEMAEQLIAAVVPADEPVDLLVLAFSIHDLQPGRATAAYLSYRCPGVPLSFAICEQGSAAAFTGLRVAREYAASAGCRRALVMVVEQPVLGYPSGTELPAAAVGVAMLFEALAEPAEPTEAGPPRARLAGLIQRAGLSDPAAGGVPSAATAALAELIAGRSDVRVLLSDRLATAWPDRPAELGLVESGLVGEPGQPATGVWARLVTELAYRGSQNPAGLLILADYDPELGYLCAAAFDLS